MADKPAQDKTEAPTPRRRSEAKDEGNVARSMDLSSVAVLFAGILALQFTSGEFIESITKFMTFTYLNAAFINIVPDTLPMQTTLTMKYFVSVLAPVLLLIMLAGIGINYIQVGVVFAKKALIPKFERISPLKGIKRLFSLRSLVELIKGLLKFGIVGFIGYYILKKHFWEYMIISNAGAGQTIWFMGQVLFELAVKICLVLFVLAVADYVYQRWDYEKNLKMTKEEVREEQKQYEGSPEVKSRIRSLQKQAARRRMMAAVPDATVVVTNPIHLAVALKYEPVEKNDAPLVIAKGKRKMAEKIKEIARQNDVPIVENKPLARSLFDTLEVGMEIPAIFYQAVAEILAYVYQLNREHSSYTGSSSYA